MSDPLTPNKAFDLQPTGANQNAWGTVLNGIFTQTDTAFGGVTSIVVTGVAAGVYTLTTTQYTPPNLEFTGVLSGNLVYALPSGVGGLWSVSNACTGAFSLTIASGGGGTSVICPQGQRTFVICDGTNVATAQTNLGSANPVALVGTTAVNGTLGTFMTSDSAPAINQAMTPTWTGGHVFQGSTTFTGSVILENTLELTSAGLINASTATSVLVPTVATGNRGAAAASTQFVGNTLSASPALGGSPTCPTQATATDNSTIATTAFVQAVIAALPVNAGNNTNGSVSIGGLIINYGQLTTPGSSPVTVNYTTAYTSAVYAVVPYLIGANQTYFVSAGFTTSLSHWTLNFGGSSQVVGWIAIGT